MHGSMNTYSFIRGKKKKEVRDEGSEREKRAFDFFTLLFDSTTSTRISFVFIVFSFWTFIRNNTNLTQISIFEKNGKILLRCTLLLVLLGLKVSSLFAKERIPQEWPYELTREKFMKVSHTCHMQNNGFCTN